MPTLGEPLSRAELDRALERLDDTILRWNYIAGQMSGSIVLRLGKEIRREDLDEWIYRAAMLLDEMTGFRTALDKPLPKSGKRK